MSIIRFICVRGRRALSARPPEKKGARSRSYVHIRCVLLVARIGADDAGLNADHVRARVSVCACVRACVCECTCARVR